MEAAVYKDNNFGEAVKGFNIMKVTKSSVANVIGAPVETGTVSFDNKVIMPNEITVEGIIETRSDVMHYEYTIIALDQMFRNRSFSFYSVSDGLNTYKDLILTHLPVTRDVDKFDFISIELKFKQALLIQKREVKPSKPENGAFVSTGRINGALSMTDY